MQAGSLNKVIKIYTPTKSRNAYGEVVEAYTLKTSTRAKMIHNGGSRTTENNEIITPYNYTFEMYCYVNVKETDYIDYKGKKYRILSIMDEEQWNKKTVQTELIND